MASARKGDGEEEEIKLRVFFIPFFATGHIIPMLDLARLFSARRGVESTMVLTPANAALIRPSIDLSASSGHPVHLLIIPFPSKETGLPPGVENLTAVSLAQEEQLSMSIHHVHGVLERLLHEHRPDAIVSDVLFWYTTGIAADLGIPRIASHPIGAFPQCVMSSLESLRPQDKVAGYDETFTVPGLPGQPIELVRSEIPSMLWPGDPLTDSLAVLRKTQRECYGAVVNTFYELEPAYCDLYRRTECRAAWFVGPIAAAGANDTTTRGGDAAESRGRCIEWLDGMEPGTVVFVCFGSWCKFSPEQTQELAVGLEASGLPFLWALRGEVPHVGKRGLVVNGWAPQVEILNHPAVGVFITHCGWNSVLEAVVAGVPMMTWPLKYEQFINERLVVGVMGAGVRVWDGFGTTVESERVVVPGEAIGRAVSGFMEGPVKKARRRLQEYKKMATAATKEGGSSDRDLNLLIDELMGMAVKKGTAQI